MGPTLPNPTSGIMFKTDPKKRVMRLRDPLPHDQNFPRLGQKRSSPGILPVAPSLPWWGLGLPAGPAGWRPGRGPALYGCSRALPMK